MYVCTGVPFLARQMMAASTPVVDISCKDDTWTIKTSTLIRTTELNFKVGEEYDEVMPSGETLKVSSFSLTHVQNAGCS
jgi:cellular retinoic acid-binding protein 2